MRHRVVLVFSFLGTQGIMLWLLLGPILDQPWMRGFRGYFANDQLSYAAIASNAAKGVLGSIEPLTETGISHYPSAWYVLLGIASNASGQPVYRTWPILGLVLLGSMLVFLGALAYRYSRLAVAPLLPGLALLTGTWSVLLHDSWFTSLGSHAVIWGPFGTFYTLNAETIGIALVVTSMGALMLASTHASRSRLLIIGSAIILGALANIQTYAFLSGVSMALFFFAVLALVRDRSVRRLAATLTSILLVMVFGSSIAAMIGPLPLFVLLIATTLPAVTPIVRRNLGFAFVTVLGFGLAAAPQVIRTIVGTLSGDDFLAYRQDSTIDLGLSPSAAVFGAIPLLTLAAFTAVTLAATRNRTDRAAHQMVNALLVALGAGAVIMASNEYWGFNQEPYRFWLQYSIATALLLSVTTAWALRQWHSLGSSWKPLVAAIGVAAVITWSIGIADVLAFRSFASDQGVLVVEDERGAILRRTVPSSEGLVLSSRCLDPQLLKLTTGAPVVWFNRGLAWPERRTLLDALMDPQRSSQLALDDVAATGVDFIITDTSCADEWRFADARLQPKSVSKYGDGTITVWEVLETSGERP